MKRTLAIVSLMLVLVMSVCMLASCNKPSGEYEAKIEAAGQSVVTTYDFSGSKFTCTVKTTFLGSVNTVETEGKFKVTTNDDDTMEITFTTENDDGEKVENTVTYEKGDGYIKLGGIEYTKK